MILACRAVVAMALFGIVCPPLHADVIPSRRAETPSGAVGRIESRLVGIGAPASAVKAEVSRLTASEAEYFAATPERLALVGRQSEMWAGQSNNLWWEWIGGIVLLTGVGIAIYYAAIKNDKDSD
jgi:hypothetical protein